MAGNTIRIEFAPRFYVVGGTLRYDAPSYIARRADQELFEGLMRGEFCYVLTARQMGKSSLMIRTAGRLREEGVGVVVLDLTGIGQPLTAEQWYGGLLAQVGQRLALEDELIEFWQAQSRLGPLQRWLLALRTVVLPRSTSRLVIFIDEIDAVRSLPFATDEFFAGIRECYNLRGEDPELERLTFCLLGVATPSDLIRDTRTTPFNVGRRIELSDFTAAEARPLARGLGHRPAAGATNLLTRVLYWTGGHPFLTQRLCQAVAEDRRIREVREVDRLCEELFFTNRARERDDNLLFVRERLLRSEADLTALLELYARVRKGRRPVADDEANPLVSILRLAGITRAAAGRLAVRNLIYARVFDPAWIETNRPQAERRRQRAAFRRGVLSAAALASLVLALVGWLAYTSARRLDLANKRAAENRRLLYFAEMRVAQEEWRNANPARVEELLTEQLPQPGQPHQEDLRGFEWFHFWHLTHRDLWRLSKENRVVALERAPEADGWLLGEANRTVTSGGGYYEIKQYEHERGRLTSLFQVPCGKNFNLMLFAPDRRSVLTDSPASHAVLWSVPLGQRLATFAGHAASLSFLAFSPDGRQVATGDMDGEVKLWATTGDRPPLSLGRHAGVISWIAFAPDGRTVTVADGSQAARVWETATGRPLPSFVAISSVIEAVSFFPDGRRALTAARTGALQIWDVGTRRARATLTGHAGSIRAIAFAPDGQQFATGSSDRTARIWSATAMGQEPITIKGHSSAVVSLAWAVDGRRLVTGGADNVVKLWDTAAPPDARFSGEPVSSFLAATFAPEGGPLALGISGGKQLKLWDLATGAERARLASEPDELLCAAFAPDRRIVATGGIGRTVQFWETATGRLLATLPKHPAEVVAIEFSPDGRWLITGAGTTTLKRWRLTTTVGADGLDLTAQEVETLRGEGVELSWRAAFSPDGKMLAIACRDGRVVLREISTRKIVQWFYGHTNRVRAVIFSADGKLLITGAGDNTVRIWQVATGRELKQLGQTDSIQRLALSPDQRRLVTGSLAGVVKLWDVVEGHELLTFNAHTAAVTSIVFSADGASLITSGADGTIYHWRAATAKDISPPLRQMQFSETQRAALSFLPLTRFLPIPNAFAGNQSTKMERGAAGK